MAFKKLTKRVYTPRKINFWTAIGYGITDFVGGGGQTIIGAWLLFFYTTYCNLSATQGALIVAIGKVVSGFCGMIMGGFSDNFYKTALGKKFGRRHFFLYFGAPLMLIFALMWVGGMNFWYYLIIYCVFDAVSTVTIPYETLPTEMTQDFNERTKLSTARMFFSASATFLATFIPGQLFKILGQNSPVPFFINGLIFAIIFATFMFITAWTTWELPFDQITTNVNDQKKRKPLQALSEDFQAYISTFKIKSFRKHLFIYLFSFTGKDVYNTVFTYFCIYVLGVSATVAANMLSLSIVGVITTLVGGLLIVKFGPRFLYILGYGIMLAMLLAYYSLTKSTPNNLIMWMFIISLTYQIGRSILEFTPWNVYPFIPDIDEIVTGRNRAGVFASVISLFRNSTAALSTVLVGMFLDANGFVKGAKVQPLVAKNAISGALIFGAGGLILIALLLALTFKVNKYTHSIIVKEIKRLKAGGAKHDATAETKRVVKQLTGYDYSRVWPASPETVNPPIKLTVSDKKEANKVE
ncbi:MFS transporter [Lactobacillus mellis]|uniref:MFS transporter n=1 Tax=Bombilactobacillus mellis TaxID=1218508 RepID=UPI0015807738|nr:MFS transporter [Bombilactobacillus mellis]NUG67334.1 MFS transporter [Bombilactobacillus mellis]